VPVSNTIAEFAIWIGKNSDRLKGMPFNKFQELVKAEFDGMVALSTLYKYAKLVGVKPRGKKANGSSIAPGDMETILTRLDSLERSMAQALDLLERLSGLWLSPMQQNEPWPVTCADKPIFNMPKIVKDRNDVFVERLAERGMTLSDERAPYCESQAELAK